MPKRSRDLVLNIVLDEDCLKTNYLLNLNLHEAFPLATALFCSTRFLSFSIRWVGPSTINYLVTYSARLPRKAELNRKCYVNRVRATGQGVMAQDRSWERLLHKNKTSLFKRSWQQRRCFFMLEGFFLTSAVDQNVMKEKKQDKVKSSSPLGVVVVFRGILEVIWRATFPRCWM